MLILHCIEVVDELNHALQSKELDRFCQSNLYREDHQRIDEFGLDATRSSSNLGIQSIGVVAVLDNLSTDIRNGTLLVLINNDRHSGFQSDLPTLGIGRCIHQLPQSLPPLIVEGIESLILNGNQDLLMEIGFDSNLEFDLPAPIGAEVFEFRNLIDSGFLLVVDVDAVLVEIHIVRIHNDLITQDLDVLDRLEFFHRHNDVVGNWEIIFGSEELFVPFFYHWILVFVYQI